MDILVKILLNGLAVFVTANILPGVKVVGYLDAVIVAIVLAVVNTLVKPVLVILTLPITILTLGIFYLVINVAMILLVDYLVPGFEVQGFLWAFVFSLVLSVVNSVLQAAFR